MNVMRLSPSQQQCIREATHQFFGPEAKVWLFGSRVDDQARGGDVDLLVETPTPMPLIKRARMKHVLERQLNLPIDLVVRSLSTEPTPFQQIARARAVPLETPL